MISYQAPVDDILFSLAHVAGADALALWDSEDAVAILGHFAQFAEGVLAPLNEIGDRQGARLENGRVRMPDGFAAAYRDLAEAGWQGLTAPEAHGGMDASPLIAAGVSEIFSGANHAMQMVCNLVPGAIATLMRFGTSEQQASWVPRLVSGEALSTMCLTEGGAGSDLSTIRCRAETYGDIWRISGEKIFISGGDQDMSETILHLVLARTGAPGDGIKGLSLFLCPAQSAVKVTRIEEKLGLHASPTCQIAFDAAEAELIGKEGAGLQAMFTVMNHARIDVALQGVASAARAGHIAATYAAERKQGRKSDGSTAVLSDHADVQRMLDTQQILAIGARAMCSVALVEMERRERPDVAEFLTPLCKIVGSEAGIKAADLGIQILGGYGYLEEYGMSQTWRDARITAIYEGANGIHAKTLATRGLRQGGGADAFADLAREFGADDATACARLKDWQDMRSKLEAASDPLPMAHEFAKASAKLFEAAIWNRIRTVADRHPSRTDLARLGNQVLR